MTRQDLLSAPPPAPSSHSIKSSHEDPLSGLRDRPFNSDASFATESSLTSGARLATRRGHPVAMSDRQLCTLANETAQAIDWDRIVPDAASGVSKWKWQENQRDFIIHTQHQSEKFAVLAIGVVPCSVPELVTVLHALNAEQHIQKMQAVHGDQFKDGALVYNVDLTSERAREVIANDAQSELTEIAVKTATFTKSNWMHSHEEWCYIDTVRRNVEGQVFKKYMATLHPKDLVVGKSDTRTKFLHGVVSGYYIKADSGNLAAPGSMQPLNYHAPGTKLTRVHFYSEFTPKRSTFTNPLPRKDATDKIVKLRMLKMARRCERLTQLIRRRRLGVQVLVDQTRILPPTNVRCFCCSNSVLVAKVCQICGQGVCGDCSQKHERETLVRGSRRLRVESIRVCDYCMERVDKSNYEHLADSSIMGPVIVPDPANTPSAKVTLKSLLQDALLNAGSDEKKASVMNVIKCVVDQAALEPTATSFGSTTGLGLLTPTSTTLEYVQALDSLDVERTPHTEAALSSNAGRNYIVDPSKSDAQMAYPVPANEAERLKVIEDSNAGNIGQSEELNIICDLAAKELDSFASLVTIITEDEQQVIAANVSSLENARFPRAEAFCSHTIMDDKPLLVPHPEADVRFHQCLPVQQLGARYYCGFPLIAEDNKTVIGSLCCIDTKSHEMTESQYAALNKLAQTAAKVVRIQGNQRRSSAAANPPTLVHL